MHERQRYRRGMRVRRAVLGDATQFELHPDGQRVFFAASARQYEFEELFVTRVDHAAPVRRLAGVIPDDSRLVDFRLAPRLERMAYRLAVPVAGGFAIRLYSAPLDGSPGVVLGPPSIGAASGPLGRRNRADPWGLKSISVGMALFFSWSRLIGVIFRSIERKTAS